MPRAWPAPEPTIPLLPLRGQGRAGCDRPLNLVVVAPVTAISVAAD